jgi:5-formyltetrahydrofolate cyclo-ligase
MPNQIPSPTQSLPQPSPKQARKQLRQARRNLSPRQRLAHELSICHRLLALPRLRRCRRIGLYLSADGEVDLQPLLLALQTSSKAFYLPVLRPGREPRLWFAPYRLGDRLRRNRYGIAEPITRQRPPLKMRHLDLVLMPLVGFDDHLNRLGMGGGYYDRSFSFLRHSQWHRPRLLGVAHECQRLPRLRPQPWDLAMDALMTETGIRANRGFNALPSGLNHKKPCTSGKNRLYFRCGEAVRLQSGQALNPERCCDMHRPLRLTAEGFFIGRHLTRTDRG